MSSQELLDYCNDIAAVSDNYLSLQWELQL